MELILWRHAEAEDGAPGADSARALTKKGAKQAERMAAWLAARIGDDWRILVSPATRTLQTVKPLGRKFEVSEAIGTGTSPAALVRETGWPGAKRNVLVVGHQPTLGEVAALLLGTEDGGLSVRKGSVWWFASRSRDGEQETLLKAVMSPEQLDA
ncbi:MAG TPA: histidine phosphatase family protein [Usitatibacter sp.]|nr:histidine phosphatase family protein [Usitatibacter sp.]